MTRSVVALAAYIVGFFAALWVDYWWFVAFVLLSPAVATWIAFKNFEYWPVVDPKYGFFWVFPAIFAILQLVFHHPSEWAQWIGWSLLLTLAILALWTWKFRTFIDREWAVLKTLAALLVVVAFGLKTLNERAADQTQTSDLAAIISSSPGGYRQGPPRLSVETAAGKRETFFVGWGNYMPLQDGRAICVRTFSGALTWQWTALASCTDSEIEASIRD
jgi:hypothetical protein